MTILTDGVKNADEVFVGIGMERVYLGVKW